MSRESPGPNGHGPAPPTAESRGVRMAQRVLSWVDGVAARLLSDSERRAIQLRLRGMDDRLEDAAHGLARRRHRRGRK